MRPLYVLVRQMRSNDSNHLRFSPPARLDVLHRCSNRNCGVEVGIVSRIFFRSLLGSHQYEFREAGHLHTNSIHCSTCSGSQVHCQSLCMMAFGMGLVSFPYFISLWLALMSDY